MIKTAINQTDQMRVRETEGKRSDREIKQEGERESVYHWTIALNCHHNCQNQLCVSTAAGMRPVAKTYRLD